MQHAHHNHLTDADYVSFVLRTAVRMLRAGVSPDTVADFLHVVVNRPGQAVGVPDEAL